MRQSSILCRKDFGNVLLNASAAPQSITVSNTGGVALTINSIGLGGASAVQFAMPASAMPCGATLNAGGSCVINCTNDNEIYSFHSGGAMSLRGDGSVYFLRQSTSPQVIIAADPFGLDPILVTGSANFSNNSTQVNDSNSLVIRGDTAVRNVRDGVDYLRSPFNYLMR